VVKFGKVASSGTRSLVDYLHRTVADFLAQPTIWSGILAQNDDATFVAPLALLKAMIMEIKTINTVNQYPYDLFIGGLWRLIADAMRFAQLLESRTNTTSVELLDELDRALTIHMATAPHLFTQYHERSRLPASWCDTEYDNHVRRKPPFQDNFMAFAILHGLEDYVLEKFKGPSTISKKGKPLLDYACVHGKEHCAPLRPKIARALLQHGADPNAEFNGHTVWQNAIEAEYEDLTVWLMLLNSLASHGANPNAYLPRQRGAKEFRRSALRLIKLKMIKHNSEFSEEDRLYRSLLSLLKSKGAREVEWHEMEDGSFRRIQQAEFKGRSIFKYIFTEPSGGLESYDSSDRWGRKFL
jgi:hypothetical protein